MPKPDNHTFHGWGLEAWALMPFSILEHVLSKINISSSMHPACLELGDKRARCTWIQPKMLPSTELHAFALSLGYL